MKTAFLIRMFGSVCGLALCVPGLVAQTCPAGETCTQIFSAVNTRSSPATANYSAPYAFSTTTVNLTCNTAPIVAQLSGPAMNATGTAPVPDNTGALQSGGNLLVDNNLFVTDTPNGGVAGPTTNVCVGGFQQSNSYTDPGGTTWVVPANEQQNCFNLNGYAIPATASGYPPGPLNGQDPDTYVVPSTGMTVDAGGGVPPIDISPLLVAGKQSVNIALEDDGGILTGSSMFISTNCTFNGVSGPATVSGNPINSGNDGGNQSFNFDAGSGQKVGFVYDVSGAYNSGTIDKNNSGSLPESKDLPVDPSTFQSMYVPNTSFATSNCLIHTGELLPNGNSACKLYTLVCTIDGVNYAGADCPASTINNEVVQDLFDGPPFALQNIYTPGGVFHQGMGFLMASETSPNPAGPCTFDAASNLQSLPCPQNLLTSFTGPGAFNGSGFTSNPNSTFISVSGVPEDNTAVLVESQWPDQWVNTSTPEVNFLSRAPYLAGGAYILSGGTLVPLPGASKYIPAPIQGITYGVFAAGSTPPMPINEPIAGAITLTSSANCAAIPFTLPKEPNFAPPEQSLASLADGKYMLWYYAQDCAGTQELKFTQDPGTGSWSTNFYTVPVNIDTTAPVISGLSVTAPGTFKVGATAYGIYSCSDAASGSGVVMCGSSNFAPETTYSTGPLKTKLNTSTVGVHTFLVYAVDGAGNTTRASINYTVTH